MDEFCGECYINGIKGFKGIPTDEKIKEMTNKCRHKPCDTLNSEGERTNG